MVAQVIAKWTVQMVGVENGNVVFNVAQDHDQPIPSPNRGDYFMLLGRIGRVLDTIHTVGNYPTGVQHIMNVRVDPVSNIPSPQPL